MAKQRRNKKSRPKLQPIDSLPTSSSQDELFRDVVLTRARSEDSIENSEAVTVVRSNDSLQQGAANNVVVSSNDEVSASSLDASDSDSQNAKSSVPTISIRRQTPGDDETSPSVIEGDHNNSASSLKEVTAYISPLTNRSESNHQPGVSSLKAVSNYLAVDQSEANPVTHGITKSSNYLAAALTENHVSPSERYASKYLPDLSPPCTPEGTVQTKAPHPTLETKTPETTETEPDSTNREEESIEGIQQPLLESELLESYVHFDVEATPIVSNVSGPIDTRASEALSEAANGSGADNVDGQIDVRTATTKHRYDRGKKRGNRLQPRSALFSPEYPKTPDEDLYDAFGFDLHKSTNAARDLNDTTPMNLEVALDQAQATTEATDAGEVADTANPKSFNRASSHSLTLETAAIQDKNIKINPSKSCRRASTVSFSDTHESNTSLKTSTIHLIGSRSEESKRGEDTDSESSFTSDEMSYFTESRASKENQEHSTSLPRESTVPILPQLPMRTHQQKFKKSSVRCNPLDMKLSLSISEEDDDELVLYQAYNPKKGDSFGSSLVESASESEEDNKFSRAISNNSFTSGSDDAGVVNELNSYLISSKIEALSKDTASSGRVTPVGGRHAQSALRRKSTNETPTPTNADGAKYIYDDVQSAIVDAKANSGAHKPQLSVDNSVCSSLQQYSIKESPKLKQMHSPGGAFQTTPQRKSQTKNAHPYTGLDSLAYSTDREYHDTTDETPFRQIKDEFDAERTICDPNYDCISQVHPSRWGVLFCVSMLNVMAGWTCFSVAPIASITTAFGDIIPEYLVSVFLLASCIGCFIEPTLRRLIGLRKTIAFGALLFMMGCLIDSAGWPIFEFDDDAGSSRIYFSFITMGCSQPFYQNTISIISCAWFPPRESGLASSIILNCYQLGIMLSFVFGTLGVNSEDDVDDYFQLLSIMSVLAFILVAFLVDDAPSNILLRPDQNHLHQEHLTQRRKKINTVTNGHKSRMSRRDITERNKDLDIEAGDLKSEAKPFLETLLPPVPSPMSEQYEYGSVGQTASPTSIQINTDLDFLSPKAAQDQIWPLMKIMLSYSGSSHCALAYVTGGVVINTLLTFICDIVKMNEGSNREIWVIGVSFPLVTMLSSYLFEKVVSRSRKLYRPILTLLAIGSVALLMCAVWPGASLNMSICILIVGFLVIPLQLLSTVLGSRVASPASNDSVLIVQRLLSNGASAAAIPVFNKLHHYSVAGGPELHDFTLPFYFLVGITVTSTMYFSTFRDPSPSYEDDFSNNKGARRMEDQDAQLWVPSGQAPRSW